MSAGGVTIVAPPPQPLATGDGALAVPVASSSTDIRIAQGQTFDNRLGQAMEDSRIISRAATVAAG